MCCYYHQMLILSKFGRIWLLNCKLIIKQKEGGGPEPYFNIRLVYITEKERKENALEIPCICFRI